jgi:hypothetical protein
MKRKFILYPAVALALMASASLSSCVDTDEPESLEALRNAKAEEVRANAGLINAKTAVENAYVAVVNANARKAEADAAYREYEALLKKQEQELDAIKKKIEGDVNNAIAQQEIDKAKADWDKLIADAKAEFEKSNAAWKAEIENAKTTVQEAELKNQVAMAQNAKEGLEQKLTTAYDEYVAALSALTKKQEDIQNFFANKVKDGTFKRSELEKNVIAKKYALDQAIADTVNFAKRMAEKGIDVFGALYVDYQNKVNAVEAELNKLDAKETELKDVITYDLQPVKNKTAEALTAANNKYNETKEAKEKDFDKKIDDLKKAKEKLSFACSNPVVVKAIKEHTTDFGIFALDSKEEKFETSSEVLKSDFKKETEKLLTVATTVKNDLLDDYKRNYEGLVAKAAAGVTSAKTQLDKDVTAWKTAVNNLKSKPTNEGYIDKVKETSATLFGEFAAGDNWMLFTNSAAYTVDGKEMAQLLVNTGKFGKSITWKTEGQGSVGKYQKALEAADMTNISNALDDADKLVKAISAKLTYDADLKALEDGKKGVPGTEEMQKLDAAKKAAKDADDAAQKAINDQNDKIQKEVTDEKTKLNNQKSKDENLATKYFGWANKISSIVEGITDLTDQTKTYYFDTYVAHAKEVLANNVASAQDDYDVDKRKLDAFDEGTYDPDKDLEQMKSDCETLQVAADKAKRTYDNLVEYYGK